MDQSRSEAQAIFRPATTSAAYQGYSDQSRLEERINHRPTPVSRAMSDEEWINHRPTPVSRAMSDEEMIIRRPTPIPWAMSDEEMITHRPTPVSRAMSDEERIIQHPTLVSRAMSDEERYTRSERSLEPAYASQKVEVWSEAKERNIPTIAVLDTGATGTDANLVSSQFLRSLQCDQTHIQSAPPTVCGLNGVEMPVSGSITLKFYPIQKDRHGEDRIHRPLHLKFYICDGGKDFGDLLLGRSYCEENEPVFRWTHVKKQTPG
jgi:hypothetical protein